jgi:hypothetical protein
MTAQTLDELNAEIALTKSEIAHLEQGIAEAGAPR